MKIRCNWIFVHLGIFLLVNGSCKSPEELPVRNNLIEIRVVQTPSRDYYLMGESIDLEGLIINNIYEDGSAEITADYRISGDTFLTGTKFITVISNIDSTKTAAFEIMVSDELINTGLPVIYIETQNAAPIVSKEDWVNMTVNVVSEKPEWNVQKTDYKDQIRGRGNSSWSYPKKPYRIKFDKKTSLFGLTAAKNWVLLANYKVATLIADTVAFELGQRFNGPLYENNYVYVDVVLNNKYQGTYILTEHMRVAEGRVEIDEEKDYLVEIDLHYDEEPKFKTKKLNLPVMICSPEFGTNIFDPRYRFVTESMNEYDTLLSDDNFPNNNWKDIIDIDSFVDYLMINEIVRNYEIGNLLSVYMCRQAGGKIRMSHLWDFDWAFGMGGSSGVNVSTARDRFLGGVFSQFHKDAEFTAKYKARWNEKYREIQSMISFIDSTADKIRASHSLNNRRWHGGVINFDEEVGKLKTWWNDRIAYLDSKINK
jgi:hypothetical protein